MSDHQNCTVLCYVVQKFQYVYESTEKLVINCQKSKNLNKSYLFLYLQVKKYRFDLQKAVNTPINAVSVQSSSHLLDKLHKLKDLLTGREVDMANRRVMATKPAGLLYCKGPGCKEACGKILLKTHTCDNLWVCSTETNSSSPIPDSMSLRYIAECGSNGSKRQAHNLKIWMVTSDLPWTVSHVRLPIEPALFTLSKMAHGKELGRVIIKKLVSVPQTR